MIAMDRRSFFKNLGVAVAPASVLSIGAPPASPSIVRAVATGRRNIPNVTVTSQEGKSYRFYDDLVRHKTVLINFFYANCAGICPRMTSNLLKIQRALGDRVGKDTFIYSISLKPEQDDVENLQMYADMHGIAPGSGWLLLHASRPNMELLRERLGFKDSDPALDADINQHTGILRFGSDVYDRWSAYPLMGRVETIAQLVCELDPHAPRKRIY
jgi:protein SCO1